MREITCTVVLNDSLKNCLVRTKEQMSDVKINEKSMIQKRGRFSQEVFSQG